VRARNPERARTFFDRMIAERDVRFTGGTTYKDSTRHYFEIAHQEYLRAIEVDFAALEAALPLERSAVA
jgi:hypothetical protein